MRGKPTVSASFSTTKSGKDQNNKRFTIFFESVHHRLEIIFKQVVFGTEFENCQ